MSLINISDAWLSFSDAPLLNSAEFHLEENECVCLVGRNGAGKSTLLKIIDKKIALDDGKIIYEQGVVVSRLQQDPPQKIAGTVFEFVAQGVEEQAEYLNQYYALAHLIESEPTEANLTRLATLQEQLDHQGLWSIDSRIRNVIEKVGLDAEAPLSSLSGGWLRKAAFARALVCEPNVLLLDEPTNHLDIETIRWLEELLKGFEGSIIFISHDRSFIRNMATRIVDLDRGKLVSWPGNYNTYLEGKVEALRVEELQNAEFDRKLAQEEVWIRQGIKARRTRNEGRVRALKSMRQERSDRREVMGNAKAQVEEASRSGKIVFELESMSYQLEDRTLINDFSVQVQRGDKIALIGANGCGKTTLIKLMLQQLQPTKGRIYSGTKLEIAYFDQHRAILNPDASVIDNLADGRQEITVGGRTRHALGYLQDFLFPPKRALTPVRALSGGERNRLLLAKLFLKPSNLLVLDEPTNDLDIETLELLEELVSDYTGTILLVSHDRQFVDNCASECWFFEDDGKIGTYVGGYYDALQQKENALTTKLKQSKPNNNSSNKAIEPTQIKKESRSNKGKLSYSEQKELTQLPEKLEQLEKRIGELQAKMASADFYTQPFDKSEPIIAALAETEKELETAFLRWEGLEERKN